MCYYVSVRIVIDTETNLDCVLLCVCAYSYRYGNQLGLCVFSASRQLIVSVPIAIDTEFRLGLCVFSVSLLIATDTEYRLGLCVFNVSVLSYVHTEYQLGLCVFMCRCL